MKYPKLIILFLLISLVSRAQTWEEWMKQKKTQTKYLLQQIAALQVYAEYGKKGYDIASKGLSTIRDIKNGDFKLHDTFLGSFKIVNPRISQYRKVAAIIAMQVHIINQTKQAQKNAKDDGLFTTNELEYFKKVCENLLMRCLATVDELMLVLADHELEMKDNERIRRIDKLYAEMQEKLDFSSSFTSDLTLMATQRNSEQAEINYSKRLNGLQ